MSSTLILVTCVFFAAVVSGLAGFAFALIAAGVLLSIRSPVEVAAIVLVCSLVGQIISVVRLRAVPHSSRALPMIGPGLVGAPLGIWLLHHVDAGTIKLALGIFLVGYCALVARLDSRYTFAYGNKWTDGLVGFVGGVLGGVGGLSGAVPAAWCLVRGWDPITQRAVYQSFIVVMQSWALVVLMIADPFPLSVWRDILVCMPVLVVGVAVGLHFFSRIDHARFRAIVLGLLAILGGVTIGAELLKLLPV